MTASLRVKNDKYYVVLTHTTDGKKNQTWVSTGLSVTGNEGKARQIMLDMLGEKPEQAAPPDMLFSDAVRRWLEDVRHRVDEVTYQGYEVQARAHILPYFLIPDGRERGILAGANVVMPNLSPREERRKYELYNDKASLGAESAEGLAALQKQLKTIGYEISTERGDFKYTTENI